MSFFFFLRCFASRTRSPFVHAFVLVFAFALVAAGCGRSDFGDLDVPDVTTDAPSDGGSDADAGPDANPDAPFDVNPDVAPDAPFDAPDGGALVAISVDPAAATVALNATTTFTARGFFGDGSSADVTPQCTWNEKDPAVLRFDFGSTFTAIGVGSSRVRCTIGAIFGEADVIVPNAKVTGLQIDPSGASLPIGGTQQFTATALFSDGSSSDVTLSALWSNTNPATGNVNGGLYTAVAAGGDTVIAQYSGVSTKVAVSVTGKTITALQVSPALVTLPIGASQQLTATALFSDGTKADVTTTSSWKSDDPATASVSNAGLATAVAKGTTNVTATFNGVSGSAQITVQPAITGIGVSPNAATIFPGGVVGLKATANFADGTSSDVTSSALWTTSDPNVATVSTSGVVTGIAVGPATITASFGGQQGTASITVAPLKLTGIVVTPANPTIPRGASLALKATGTFQDGSTKDITASVTWSVVDPTVASVSNAASDKGTATGLAIGKTTVSATQDGVVGSTTISVSAATITSIAITPNPINLVQGTKQFADAVAKFTDGTTLDVTATCTWASGNAGIAAVSNAAGAQGQVSAVAAGTTNVTCTQSGVVGSTTVVVSQPTLASLSISPVAPTCNIGDTLTFQATAIDTSGRSTNVTNMATWSSDAPTIVQPLGAPGRFRCVATGKANVSAKYQTQTASTPVTVGAAVVTSIQVDPVDATLAVGETQQYQAIAIFSDGTSQNVTAQATFQSSNAKVASIATAGATRGRATALAAGTTTISATYRGVTGSTNLTVSSATLVSISVSPVNRTVPAGIRFPYTADAIYSDGTSKDVTALATWTSSNGAAAQVSDAAGSKGQATAIAAGTTTITATYQGVSGSTSLTVSSAKIVQLQITPFKPTIPVGFGENLTATAIYDDGTHLDVTAGATWTASTPSVAAVSDAAGSKGRVTTSAAGQSTITATFDGVSGSDVVTVSSATLATIAITPNPATVSVNGSTQLTATGTFSDGTTLDVTNDVTWTSSNTTTADVSNATGSQGQAFGFAAGSVTITARRGAVTGTTPLTVQ